MLVSSVNDIRVYNLSAGKSLPDWLTERKRRKLNQDNSDVRRRIELIQDFDMPDVSGCVTMSNDGQFILATGTYKPRLRCYDVRDLSMKFERCVDAEIVKLLVLSDGFEKLALLEDERYIELHSQSGNYFRVRMPRFGRDMCYYSPAAELIVSASGRDIYRLNLEHGRFMTPLTSCAQSTTSCAINPHHYLLITGTDDCRVECWDIRERNCVATIDCAPHCTSTQRLHDNQREHVVLQSSSLQVTSVQWKDAMHMAVGTSHGECILYDIRSSRPLLVKDTHNDLPIKRIQYIKHAEVPLVATLDSKALKFWHESDGKPYVAIEPEVQLNDVHFVENTGVLFMACEAPKLQTYYLPSIGPAPKWCAFLDNITEELEETETPAVFDDYKFVTLAEVEAMGLSNLLGTNTLRAYMHGYFIDARLYAKARQLSDPFAYEEFRKKKLKERLDAERANAGSKIVKPNAVKLPKINRDLAERLTLETQADTQGMKSRKKVKAKAATSLLTDERFGALFKDTDYEVDMQSEEYRLLNPALDRLHETKEVRRLKLLELQEQKKDGGDDEEEDEDDNDDNEDEDVERAPSPAILDYNTTEGQQSSSNVDALMNMNSSDDDEVNVDERERKKQTRMQLQAEAKRERGERRRERMTKLTEKLQKSSLKNKTTNVQNVQVTGVQSLDEIYMSTSSTKKMKSAKQQQQQQNAELTFAERLTSKQRRGEDSSNKNVDEIDDEKIERVGDGHQVTFRVSGRTRDEISDEQNVKHAKERRKIRRSAGVIEKTLSKAPTQKFV